MTDIIISSFVYNIRFELIMIHENLTPGILEEN